MELEHFGGTGIRAQLIGRSPEFAITHAPLGDAVESPECAQGISERWESSGSRTAGSGRHALEASAREADAALLERQLEKPTPRS